MQEGVIRSRGKGKGLHARGRGRCEDERTQHWKRVVKWIAVRIAKQSCTLWVAPLHAQSAHTHAQSASTNKESSSLYVAGLVKAECCSN